MQGQHIYNICKKALSRLGMRALNSRDTGPKSQMGTGRAQAMSLESEGYCAAGTEAPLPVLHVVVPGKT